MDGSAFRELDEYNSVIDGSTIRRLNSQLRKMASTPVETACALLTTASLMVTQAAEVEVLVFVENGSSRIRPGAQDSADKPDLVAFFAPRRKAEQLLTGRGTRRTFIPSSHHNLVSVVVTRPCTDKISHCKRYLLSLSSYNPASFLQFGLVVDGDGFVFVALGLDNFRTWPKVTWDHPTAIRKLCTCVQVIRKAALKDVPPVVPKLAEVVSARPWAVGMYTVRIGDELFRLLPIYSRAKEAKPFVALGIAEGKQDYRIFKYSWYTSEDEWRECELLKRLSDVPGVVHLDERLSIDSIEMNESKLFEDGVNVRTRCLLVLRTIGHPLCACESVLEFLEAMYDLLEVLRYLVQERNVLHRDVSWGNVLIRPAEFGSPRNSPKIIEKASDNGDRHISHTYRFVSDIFKEDERKIRVALTDFGHATDLNSCGEDELRVRAGTRMFMADDVLTPRFRGMPTFTLFDEQFHDRILGDHIDKYATQEESDNWDDFYRHNISLLKWNIEPKWDKKALLQDSFRHGAVHDAESVFYICLLFFNRMWPLNERVRKSDIRDLQEARGELFKVLVTRGFSLNSSRLRELPRQCFGAGERFDPFYGMLRTIHSYLEFPWYNASSTGRGERYEFHLHDFMQRLLLTEIKRLRKVGDPMYIEENPLPVRLPSEVAEHLRAMSHFTLQPNSIGEVDDRARHEKKRFRTRASLDLSRSKSPAGLPVPYTVKPRRPMDESNTGGSFDCRRDGSNLRNLSEQDGLVLPVDRPREMPQHLLNKFDDPTGRSWDIYWWKIRESLWFKGENL
ncbi:hypothetical protein A7U60_g1318 [Sanghuangporus baumii]|uniref:Protein kinase domain-containing protein n=1 Tax=Sanghuangporus baumii TaxID=108892 RepID=A0A9Q5N9B2_SANBA|nr:hypothetical protein A7U60_g1318 [Sanghuangporus baumii]